MRRVLAMIVALALGAAGASKIVDSVPARDVPAQARARHERRRNWTNSRN